MQPLDQRYYYVYAFHRHVSMRWNDAKNSLYVVSMLTRRYKNIVCCISVENDAAKNVVCCRDSLIHENVFGWPHLHQINKIMHELLFLVLSCFYGLCSAANRYTMIPERTELRNILISDNIFHKTESTSVLDCFRQCDENALAHHRIDDRIYHLVTSVEGVDRDVLKLYQDNARSTNRPNDVATPTQICQMLGYVLLWLWTIQSEPLDGDASHMRASIPPTSLVWATSPKSSGCSPKRTVTPSRKTPNPVYMF